MTIAIGDPIPNVKVMMATQAGPQSVESKDLLGSGKVALFSVPGAFTPTCSAKHLPGFVNKAREFQAKGVDKIVCMSVNDVFVMDAWSKDQNADGKVEMLADGNGDFARALGLVIDSRIAGMGERSRRFSMVLEHGIVKHLNVDQPGAFEVSSAEHMLDQV